MCWDLVVVYFWSAVVTSSCYAIIPNKVKNGRKPIVVGTGMVMLSCAEHDDSSLGLVVACIL